MSTLLGFLCVSACMIYTAAQAVLSLKQDLLFPSDHLMRDCSSSWFKFNCVRVSGSDYELSTLARSVSPSVTD